MYFHNLVNREKHQMIYSFFMTQYHRNCKGDWVLQVEKDFKDFNLISSFSFLENISKEAFKKLVLEGAKPFAFEQLLEKKKSHTKMNKLSYINFEIQDYLLSNDISLESKKMLFKWRVHMEDFGHNYRSGRVRIPCPLCSEHEDSPQNIFYVRNILSKTMNIKGRYKDILSLQISISSN